MVLCPARDEDARVASPPGEKKEPNEGADAQGKEVTKLTREKPGHPVSAGTISHTDKLNLATLCTGDNDCDLSMAVRLVGC